MIGRLVWACAICATAAGALQADDAPAARLTPEETYRAAFASLDAGRITLTRELTEALLVRDPRDFSALILLAHVERASGNYDKALAAGRTARRVATTPAQKYAASMVIAQALSSDGKRTRAQLWLRRAADIAPNEATRNLAARDFRYVRSRNPWATELSFNIAPTDNVNNGSLRDSTQLFGMPFEFVLDGAARALSGTEYSGGIATRYRFDQSEHHARDLMLQFSHRGYVLSGDAKAQAPGVKGSDFAFTQAAIGYVYRGDPQGGLGPYSISATLGHSLYGGEDYLSYARLGATKQFRLTPRAQLTVQGSAERQFGVTAPDADILRGDVTWRRAVGKVGALGLSMGATDSQSATDVSDYSELRGGIDFQLAKPILGAQVTLGLQYRQRAYPTSRFDPTGRDDREVSARLDMVFTKIERYGFNPTLSITRRRTESNIGLFDSAQTGVRFGIRSAF
jgi:tetratricopeptide (TPR) repeat protein